MKVSRNSPCQCGSGKKHKNCCLNEGSAIDKPIPSKSKNVGIDKLLIDALLAVSALQGFPENSNRLIALQEITLELLRSSNSDLGQFTFKRLNTTFFNRQWSHGTRWNKPDIFATNVTSFVGNTTILPGLVKGGSLLLQTLLNVIFLDQLNEFPKGFHEEAYAATYFILKVASAFAEENMIVAFDDTYIHLEFPFVPDEATFETASGSCLLDREAIKATFTSKKLPLSVIDEFMIDLHSLPTQFDEHDNPLLLRPFLDAGKALVVLSPVNLLSALYFYLWRSCVKHGCTDQVSYLYNEEAATTVKNIVFHLDWKKLHVGSLPINDPNISVFQMDTDKLSIVIYVPDLVSAENYRANNPIMRLNDPEIGSILETQLADVNVLLDNSAYRSFKRLFVAVIGNTGREAAIKLNVPEHPFLMFAYHDWIALCRGRNDYHSLVLWYFVQAKERFLKEYDTAGMSLLEMFALYIDHGECFYLSNDVFESYEADPSLTPKFLNGAEQNSAAMVLPYQDGSVPPVVFIPVMVLDKYDEVYMPDPVTGRLHEFAIKGFPQTIWFKPADQERFSKYSGDDQAFFTEVVKMVAYWIKQVKDDLADHLELLPFEVIEIFVDITDPELFFKPVLEKVAFPDGHHPVKAHITTKGILLEFNSAFAELLDVPDNRAERRFLEVLLSVLNQIFRQSGVLKSIAPLDITTIVAKAAPLGRKKKLTIFNSVKDVRQLNNNLGRVKYLRSYQTNSILDDLTIALDPEFIKGLPEITDKDEKLKFLGQLIFKVLIPRLRDRLKSIDTEILLGRLIGYYEKLIHKKKAQEVNVPTVKYCYPNFYDTYMHQVHDNNNDINQASIAYRCLIEFISAEQHGGSEIISDELIDELMAIMITIVDLGIIDDQLFFDLSNDHLSILPSGRVGFQRHFLLDFVHPYQHRQTEHIIAGFHEDFDDLFPNAAVDDEEQAKSSVLIAKINAAYREARGFTFEQLINFLIDISYRGLEQKRPFAWLYRNDLLNIVQQKQPELDKLRIEEMLDLMCSYHRGNALKPPKGIDNYEASPWRFNRLLSYLSKPLVEIRNDADKENPKIYFGIRHLVDVAEQIQVRIMEGRLRDPKLASLSAAMLDRKGKVFNRALAEWIKKNSTLLVFPELGLPGTLGDVDVLAIDEVTKRLYLIEAKNTTPSKVAKEMAEERDRFLVSDGDGPGWMEKHSIRYQAVIADISILSIRTNVDLADYTIIPLFVTLQDVLIPYLLRSNKYNPNFNMPIFSFGYLKEEGLNILANLTYITT